MDHNMTAAMARGLELISRNREAEVASVVIERLKARRLVTRTGGRYRPTKIGDRALSEHFDTLAALDYLPPCRFAGRA